MTNSTFQWGEQTRRQWERAVHGGGVLGSMDLGWAEWGHLPWRQAGLAGRVWGWLLECPKAFPPSASVLCTSCAGPPSSCAGPPPAVQVLPPAVQILPHSCAGPPPQLCRSSLQLCRSSLQLCRSSLQLCRSSLQLCRSSLQLCRSSLQLCRSSLQLCRSSLQLCRSSLQLCRSSPQLCRSSPPAVQALPPAVQVLPPAVQVLCSSCASPSLQLCRSSPTAVQALSPAVQVLCSSCASPSLQLCRSSPTAVQALSPAVQVPPQLCRSPEPSRMRQLSWRQGGDPGKSRPPHISSCTPACCSPPRGPPSICSYSEQCRLSGRWAPVFGFSSSQLICGDPHSRKVSPLTGASCQPRRSPRVFLVRPQKPRDEKTRPFSFGYPPSLRVRVQAGLQLPTKPLPQPLKLELRPCTTTPCSPFKWSSRLFSLLSCGCLCWEWNLRRVPQLPPAPGCCCKTH
ncbi:uncharacterized protein LOC132648308 [Meriones unguiculatus]|uniref:uncharacterized protein LOC132648308 n=1 Tax=Meriones unguiculatus TaxID=10047 RepID=UPI00293E58B4|nr:uncharacterized protein LOC132648308 [Meriones unguiculatus]